MQTKILAFVLGIFVAAFIGIETGYISTVESQLSTNTTK
jgi:hypothetical protein